jgi:ABC-type methionine transport system ATPase subunit
MNQTESKADLCSDGDKTPPAIRLSGVSKSFVNGDQTIQVLDDIDLTVPSEAIIALIGASGSGKSTLLNIISGLLKPDRGQVCICGAAGEEFNDWCSVSYMFQDDRLLPWRTAIRNVEFALEAGSIGRAGVASAAASRVGGLRSGVPISAFRRHAQPCRTGAEPRDGAAYFADGRTVLTA